ncbi:MAG: S8/S53 family peptidase [Thermoflexales bacterium]
MSPNSDQMPAFYLPNHILCQFVSENSASDSAFSPRDDNHGLILPEWLWQEMQDVFHGNSTGHPAEQPVYPLVPTAAGRTVVLAQCTLSDAGDDAVIAILELLRVNGLPNSFSDGRVKLTLAAVSPNWFGGGAGQTIGTGGPGGPPLAPIPGDQVTKPFVFPNAALNLAPNRGLVPDFDPSHVDVFILDTLPKNIGSRAKGIVNHVESCDARLLKELVENNVPLYSAANPYYDMSDHGLFIAGIIRNIAPHSKIHLIEVLNEYGVGTTMSIAAGCAKVVQLRQSNATACIVNCSFTLSVPIDPHLVGWPLKVNTTRHPEVEFFMQLLGDHAATSMTRAGDLFGSILKFIGPEDEDSTSVAIVAAAGNDTKETDTNPCPPRYPAALPNVLGVGAMAGDQRAAYSNIPDSPGADGLMTLGAIRSVYLNATFPNVVNGQVMPLTAPGTGPLVPAQTHPRSGANAADWSGTSFAAPVIAGILANMVSVPGRTLASAQQLLAASVAELEPQTKGRIVTVTQA